MKKNFSRFIPWIICGLIVLLCTLFYLNMVKKQQAFKDLDIKIAQLDAAYAIKLKEKCQFPDGYAPLDREGWFDVNKFYAFTQEARNEAKQYVLDKDRSWEVMPVEIHYKLNNQGQCYISSFQISMLWNGKKLKPNFIKSFSQGLSLPQDWSPVGIFVCLEKSCIKPKADKGLVVIYSNPTSDCHYQKEFALTHNANLTFSLWDCDTKDGLFVYGSGNSQPERLTVKNFSNRGYGFSFYCTSLYLWKKDLPVAIKNIQSIDFKNNYTGCLTEHGGNTEHLYFDEGSVFLTFNTNVLSDVPSFFNVVLENASQFTVKDKIK